MDIKNVGNLNPYTNSKVQGGSASQGAERADSAQTGAKNGDTVSLSGEAKLRGTALNEAVKSSDVRQEKVRDLKEKVKNGTYEPDLKKAAANLLREDLQIFGR